MTTKQSEVLGTCDSCDTPHELNPYGFTCINFTPVVVPAPRHILYAEGGVRCWCGAKHDAVPAKPNQPKFEDNYSEAAYFAGITITQAIQCDLALRDLRAGVPLPWHTVHANPNVEREMADELLRLSDVVCEEDAAIIETLLKKAGVL